jgi:hypothetical protein
VPGTTRRRASLQTDRPLRRVDEHLVQFVEACYRPKVVRSAVRRHTTFVVCCGHPDGDVMAGEDHWHVPT